jgi:hypothetical protein
MHLAIFHHTSKADAGSKSARRGNHFMPLHPDVGFLSLRFLLALMLATLALEICQNGCNDR